MPATEERAEILEKALSMGQHYEPEKWSLGTESEGGDFRSELCYTGFSCLTHSYSVLTRSANVCAPTPVSIPAQSPLPERYRTRHIHFTFVRGNGQKVVY
jgi:hypothetical protein